MLKNKSKEGLLGLVMTLKEFDCELLQAELGFHSISDENVPQKDKKSKEENFQEIFSNIKQKSSEIFADLNKLVLMSEKINPTEDVQENGLKNGWGGKRNSLSLQRFDSLSESGKNFRTLDDSDKDSDDDRDSFSGNSNDPLTKLKENLSVIMKQQAQIWYDLHNNRTIGASIKKEREKLLLKATSKQIEDFFKMVRGTPSDSEVKHSVIASMPHLKLTKVPSKKVTKINKPITPNDHQDKNTTNSSPSADDTDCNGGSKDANSVSYELEPLGREHGITITIPDIDVLRYLKDNQKEIANHNETSDVQKLSILDILSKFSGVAVKALEVLSRCGVRMGRKLSDPQMENTLTKIVIELNKLKRPPTRNELTSMALALCSNDVFKASIGWLNSYVARTEKELEGRPEGHYFKLITGPRSKSASILKKKIQNCLKQIKAPQAVIDCFQFSQNDSREDYSDEESVSKTNIHRYEDGIDTNYEIKTRRRQKIEEDKDKVKKEEKIEVKIEEPPKKQRRNVESAFATFSHDKEHLNRKINRIKSDYR